MRDLLTGLAIILIVVLTTMLVAPYFVDWTGQRAFLEARLTHALGQKVTIGGNIDLKLLPTPYLVLDQVVVGGDDGAVRIGIHHLDLELTVAPLLHGEFDIVEARLVEPTIRLNLEHDRTLPTLPTAPAFQADVRFDRIQVSNGTLAIADALSGRTFVLDHLDLDADAESFAGPFKVSGAEGPDGARTKFHLATTAADKGRARGRLVIEETPTHAGLELDGALDLATAGRDTLRQSFDGTLALSGHLWQVADAPIGWTLSGPLKADPRQATLDGGELRLGNEDAGVTLQAKASAAIDETPKLTLALSAKQLDLDRLSGAPADAVKPPPPRLPDLETLRRIFAAAIPPVQTSIDVAVDDATYGGETLSDLQAHLGLSDIAQPLKVSGDGPGGSHIAVDGQLTMATDLRFLGAVAVEADNLPRAVDWLASVAPSLAWTGRDMPFKTVKVAGHVAAAADEIAGDALAVTLDRSVLGGTARLAFGDASRPTKITADLTATALDLDGLPSLGTLRGATALDVDVHLDAKALKVAQIGDGPLTTGHIRLAIAKTGTYIALTDFRADDLGGAKILANGGLDPVRGQLAMTLDATHLDAAAALVRQLVPGAMADALVARASVLAPAKLKIDAALAQNADGVLAPAQLSIAGTLGATRIAATAKPDASEVGASTIAASLTAPDGGALLSQIGIPALPMEVIGPSRATLMAHGTAGGPLDTTLAVALGATKIEVDGRFDLLSAMPTGSGKIRLRSPDLTPLLQSLAVAFPDMTGSDPADAIGTLALDPSGGKISDLNARAGGLQVSGDVQYRRDSGDQPALSGALAIDKLALSSLLGLALGSPQPAAVGVLWSRQPFAVGLIDPPQSVFTLKVKTLDIAPGVAATNAGLSLGVSPNLVTLSDLAADLSGGRVSGGVTVRRDGRQATLEGTIALDDVTVRLAALDTRVTGKLALAGGGDSAQALVASLAGSGDATATDLSLPGGDPRALPKIFQDVETDALAVDEDAVIRAFDDAAKAPLAAGTRHFALSLAAGLLHADPTAPQPAADAAVSSKVDATFDLTQSRLDAHLEETLNALPKNWTGPPPTVVITWSGSLDRPTRTLDVSGFLNAVAARALARETARIETYEFDIRERAIFNARLQSERRREEERQKAEDDARQAEAERQARVEAQRREALREERLRREQAARAAQEKADREKGLQQKALQEKAARAEAERAARERETDKPPPPRDTPAPDTGPQPPGDSRQAPAPGSDPSTLGRY